MKTFLSMVTLALALSVTSTSSASDQAEGTTYFRSGVTVSQGLDEIVGGHGPLVSKANMGWGAGLDLAGGLKNGRYRFEFGGTLHFSRFKGESSIDYGEGDVLELRTDEWVRFGNLYGSIMYGTRENNGYRLWGGPLFGSTVASSDSVVKSTGFTYGFQFLGDVPVALEKAQLELGAFVLFVPATGEFRDEYNTLFAFRVGFRYE